MKLLVLGGTQFVGRHIVQLAVARGHDVSTFTRGKTPDELPEGVERLHGDRDGNLSALEGRSWDAVIDVSGYVPRIVRASAELLRGSAPHYVFVSTISVYEDLQTVPVQEDNALKELSDPTVEQVTGETYGGLKVLCERAVTDVYGDACAFIRPDIVAGPYDPTDRFTYWPERLARGEEVLAPGDGSNLVQFIDARDLAAFTLDAAERRLRGAHNVTGDAVSFREFLQRAVAAVGTDVVLTWVSADFLREREVGWGQLPLFIPDPATAGLMNVSSDRARGDGLQVRPLEDTVKDTLAWAQGRGAGERKVGLPAGREQELLREWHAK